LDLAYFIFPTGKKEDVLDLVDYAADLHSSPRDDGTEQNIGWENCFYDVCAGRGIGKDIAIGFAPSAHPESAKRVSFDTAT
jgi:hypothetical protein